jgi:uncharacterized protein (TIGR01777 family)
VTRSILISGASGLLGSAARRAFTMAGDRVTALVRRAPRGDGEIRWDPAAGQLDPATVGGFDAVLHFSGAGIGDARWTARRKQTLRSSRIDSTELLSEALASSGAPPQVMLSASAIGWYGDRGDEILNEGSTKGTGFLADLCRDWEAATVTADAAGIRVAHLRTGLVLSGSGGLMASLLPVFRLGAGGKIGDGTQWMSWITIDDYIRALDAIIDGDAAGPVNMVGPAPVTNAEFTVALGAAIHRPTVLTIPRFAVEARMGKEAAAETAFVSQRVMPGALASAGFTFVDTDVTTAMERVLGGS